MNCRVEKKVSKNNTEYYCLIIELVPGLEKQVFLDAAEVKVIELTQKMGPSKQTQ